MDLLNEYQNAAAVTSKMETTDHWYFALGLCDEAGEVAGKVKKLYRDDGGHLSMERKEAIKLELGDALWYLAVLAKSFDIDLSEVARANIAKLRDRQERGTLHGDGDVR